MPRGRPSGTSFGCEWQAYPLLQKLSYGQGIETGLDDSSAWYGLHVALKEAGDASGSEAARARAVELDPILDHDLLLAGDRLWLNGEYEAALPVFRRYLESHPEGKFTAHTYRRIGGCLMRLHRDQEAIAAFEEVIARAPRHGDTLLDLGILHREMGQMGRAISYLSQARQSLPERATYATALGTTYVLARRLEEGAATLKDAVERHPCSARARRNLAATLAELGRASEAAEHFRVAVALAPTDPQTRALEAQMVRAGVHLFDVPPRNP